MRGNLLGEQFDLRVSEQINIRQKTHGSGFSGTRSTEQINYLNNRNAWLKMASSVYVVGDSTNTDINIQQKTGKKDDDGKDITKKFNFNTDVDADGVADGINRLKDIGISNPENFVGNLLAQQTVLFNTLSTVNPSKGAAVAVDENGVYNRDATTSGTYDFRSGVTKSNGLWNNNSYGLGGTDFGLSPAPGLIDASIECVNRGSIRKCSITLKAYNKFQFELLELVYMRLGYSVMLEWGWDKYIANDGSYQQVENTIIEDKWFSQNGVSQVEMIEDIKNYRNLYDFNYDAFFGKVTNFEWTFNADGTYDIKLDLITIGDVIESLSVTAAGAQTSEDAILLDTEDATWPFSNGDVFNKLAVSGEGIEGNNIIAGAGSNKMSEQLYLDVRDRDFSKNETEEDRNFFSWEVSRAESGQNYPEIDQSNYNYFMTFGQLMRYLSENTCPTVMTTSGKARKQVEFDGAEYNIMSAFPNMVSLDPRVCLIKPLFFDSEGDGTIIYTPSYFKSLSDCVVQNGDILFGRIMNIYINFEHIAKLLNSKNKDGDLSMFSFLEELCKDINAALGNVCNLEPILKDDYIVTIIDQNPIPGLIPKDTSTPLEVFGYNVNNNTSNFVTDIKFTSKITPAYATQISIGATGGTSKTKNQDSTAFSKWNVGLLDRFAAQIVDATGGGTPTDQERIQKAWEDGEEVGAFREGLNKTGNFISGLILGDDGVFDSIEAVSNVWKIITFRMPQVVADRKTKGINTSAKEAKSIEDGGDGPAKNIKFLGKGYDNYEYEEWKEKGKQILQAIEEEKKNARLTTDDYKAMFGSNYNLWLVRAFGGKTTFDSKLQRTNSTVKTISFDKTLYTKMEGDFIGQGKSAFKAYMVTTTDQLMKKYSKPSGKIGFIPVDLSLTLEGMSGILIYNSLPIRQNFLPKQYDRALKFIITKVNHKISGNSWTTSLNTLATSPVETFPLGAAITKQFSSENTFQTYESSGPIPSDQAFRIVDSRPGAGGNDVSIDYIVSQFNNTVQTKWRSLFEALNEKYPGYTAYVNAIGRTNQKSAELQSQGANAAPGKSKHNYYSAVDMNIRDPKGKTFMKKEREPWLNSGIVTLAESLGFKWGGNFSGYVDSIHFYTDFNINVAYQNAQADNAGKGPGDWETKNTKLTGTLKPTFNYQQQYATVTQDPVNPEPGATVTVYINYNDGQGKIASGTGTVDIPIVNRNQSQQTRNAINAAELQAKGDVINQLS